MSHWEFEPGELALPIHKILWAPTNDAHYNHLHVEGYPPVNGTLSNDCTSKWTEAITEIRGALDGKFGEGDHWMVDDDTLGWTHMGVYNCRPIAGTATPSQHAFSNAIDIGPYYGQAQQQKFYDFLTRKKGEDMALTKLEEDFVKDLYGRMAELYPEQVNKGEAPTAAGISTYLIPLVRKGLVTKDMLTSGNVDTTARNTANAAKKLAEQIRAKLKNLY